MPDVNLGYGYYKDDKGTYKLNNGKKVYLDNSLNTDNSTLVTNRGGTAIWTDGTSTFSYNNGTKVELGTGEPIVQDNKPADDGHGNLQDSWKSLQDEPIFNDDDNKDDENEKSDLSNQYRTDIVNLMQTFRNTLDKIDEKFNKNRAIYTMYVKVTMKSGEVLVDSTSKDLVDNCLVSLVHKMNGSGQANTFTLDLLFKPSDRSILSIKNIEDVLLAHCQIYKNENEKELKDVDDIYCNCTFQYGYGDDLSLRSPLYAATIMNYNCKLENGNLRYTITGYCGLYNAKEYRLYPKTEYLTDKDDKEIDAPLDYLRRIFEIEFSENNFYDIKFINIPNPHSVKYPGDDYKQFGQKNIFQVVSDILSGCMTEAQYRAMTGDPAVSDGADEDKVAGPSAPGKKFFPNQKQLFGYYIDDKSSSAKYGTVMVYQMESLYGEENKNKTAKADCNIKFSWFGPSNGSYNHLVKEWNPSYDGSVLMALATTFITGGDTYHTMNSDGDIVEVTGLGTTRLGINDDDSIFANKMILSTIQEYNNWSFVTQYPYKASMTIIGCPCEVPMTGKIEVIALMGNERHHSSGVYMVLGKVDKINSSGFFSELELFKITPGFNPNYVTVKQKKQSSKGNTIKFESAGGKYFRSVYNEDGELIEINEITKEEYESNTNKDNDNNDNDNNNNDNDKKKLTIPDTYGGPKLTIPSTFNRPTLLLPDNYVPNNNRPTLLLPDN